MTLYQFLDVNPAGSAVFELLFELDSLAAVASPASQSAADESEYESAGVVSADAESAIESAGVVLAAAESAIESAGVVLAAAESLR
jgi:hypothetical protein